MRDTGPGIPAEDLPRVWERFYRVEKSHARSRGGAGLGLAIVKQIVEAHGGMVDVESRPAARGNPPAGHGLPGLIPRFQATTLWF